MNTIRARLIQLNTWLNQLPIIVKSSRVFFYTVNNKGGLFGRSTLKDRLIALQLLSLGHTIINNVDIASASVTIR